MGNCAQMAATEVVQIITWLEATGVIYQINGGWGVDGLVGRQTRLHQDLDVFIDAHDETKFLTWLTSRGYRVTQDWRPVRVELSSPGGRIDVHPMRMDAAGNGVQQGLNGEVYVHAAEHRVNGFIDGHAVVVASGGIMLELQRTGAGTAPRVHLDIETDDVPAETARVVSLGATIVRQEKGYAILADPGGVLFCVVPVQTGADFEAHATTWD